jgi:transcriptional regulator with XRE-family HTH domain
MSQVELSPIGGLLKRWRMTRRLSQFELGLEADVSARHISFIETGRSRPSREMVLILSDVLDVPLRERNILLQAAGYASIYRETGLSDPQMAQVREALKLLLKQNEPFGAIAFDRRWDIVMVNEAYIRFIKLLLGEDRISISPLTLIESPRLNLLNLLFDPKGLRPYISNWEEVAREVLSQVHRVVSWNRDPEVLEMLKIIFSYPGVPVRWREPDLEVTQSLIIPVELRFGEMVLRFFSTITTLGTPQDITLQELRIEAFHPVDTETEAIVRAMAT